MRTKFSRYTRIMAAVLTIAVLLSVACLPVKGEGASTDATVDGEDAKPSAGIGSEEYRTRFTTDEWYSASDSGEILENTVDGVKLDIQKRGAGLRATLLDYEGQTPCNALQIVMANQSACTSMQLDVTYHGGEQASCSLRISAQTDRSVYYAYLDDVDGVESITITFNSVSDGQITLFSLSRVSFYEQLTEDTTYGTVEDCIYDPQSGSLTINGRVRSDSIADFSGGGVSLYRLSPLQDAYTLTEHQFKPLQMQKISNHFTFTITEADLIARNSRYAIVLTDPKGNRVLMCEPVYPVQSTEALPSIPTGYKGLQSSVLTQTSHCFADTVIVDVYLDRLQPQNPSTPETFSYHESYYTFDLAYINELQDRILPQLMTGCSVYLRLLIEANQNGYALPFTVSYAVNGTTPEYLALTLDHADAVRGYGAALTYLLSRLTASDQTVDGIVLGRSVDNSLTYHYAGILPLREYLQKITATLMFSANVLRENCPGAVMYLPVSDTKYPDYYTSYDLDGVYATPMLLDGICRMLDDSTAGEIVFYPLLEMTTTPLGLNNALLEQGEAAVQLALKQANSTDGSEDKPTIESLLEPLSKYHSIGTVGSVLWQPGEDCTGIARSLEYIYLYYTLQRDAISTFFFRVDEEDLPTMFSLISRINTSSAFEVVNFALPYFGLNSSVDLNAWITAKQPNKNTPLYQATLTTQTKETYAGRYVYWDFASAIGTLQWTAGYGCRVLSADGGSRYGRALLAQMEQKGGEILYRFQSPENFSVCDALSLTLAVTDRNGQPIPARIQLTFFGEDRRIEATCDLASGELTALTLQGVPLSVAMATKALSVHAEPLNEQPGEEVRIYLLNVEGLSLRMDSQALQNAIFSEREKAEHSPADPQQPGIYPVILVTALALVVIAGSALSLRASQKRKKRDFDNRSHKNR